MIKIARMAQRKLLEGDELAEKLAAELFWEFETGKWRNNQYLLSSATALGRDFFEKENHFRNKIIRILNSLSKKSESFQIDLPIGYPVSWVLDWVKNRIGN